MKKILALFALLLYSPVVLFAVPNIVPVHDNAGGSGAGGDVNLNDGSGNPISSTAGALDVNIASGASSGTQYTEGDTDASITGTALMVEGAANTLVAAPGTAADGLLVNLGANNDVTVTGTVAVTQSGTWDELGINDSGNSITIDAPVGTPAFVRLSDGASAISTLPVSLASVPSHAVTNAGTFAVQESGSALTALQLIDDGVYTDDTSTHSTGSSKGYGIMAAATPTDTAVNANDLGVVGMTNNRELYVSLRDIAGATAVTGSGTATGALRVELANNGTGLVTANPATAANWGVYVEDAGETAGGNLEMLGTVRRDTAASSAGTTGDNATLNTDANGYVWSRTADPCSAQIPTTVAISQTASTKLISQAASKTNYVCSAVIVAGAAEVVNIIEGTGTTCGTSTAAVAGSTTAANGISLAANGGFTINSPVKGTGTNLDLCLSQSGSNRVSGYITYVQQ